MRWFVRGDIDGFFGLALDNLVQLLLINALCKNVLGFSDDLLYRHILPGAAVSLLVGNLFYSWQAKKLADATGRTDVCSLPYGINTVSLIAHVFLVMLPAKGAAEAAGMSDPARVAWQAGLVACLGSGLIEFCGAFVAERVRKATPRAALLSTLAGIALGFISFTFLFRTFARPVVGLTTFGIVLLVYFGGVRFKGGLPGGLVAVGLGTALAWLTGIAPDQSMQPGTPGLFLPVPVFNDLVQALQGKHLVNYISVIIAMGLFNVIGSLQNIESAEAAGDPYPTRPSLAVNGLGTLAAAAFGSCFPTTIYIGHPGWKALGARAGYSILNGVFFTVVALTGVLAHIAWAVPIDAGMAIVVWIGIVITAQAFQATPRKHAPAVVVGLLPGVGAWGMLMTMNALRAAADVMKRPTLLPTGTKDAPPSLFQNPEELIQAFQKQDTWITGVFALNEGFIFTSMVLAAATVALIERHFLTAAAWAVVAAVLSAVGLMHSYQWTPGGPALSLTPAWDWVIGYGIMAVCFLAARWLTEPGGEHGESPKEDELSKPPGG